MRPLPNPPNGHVKSAKIVPHPRGTVKPFDRPRPPCYTTAVSRGCSSAGRARQSHCRGQEFEPPHLHHDNNPATWPKGAVAQLGERNTGSVEVRSSILLSSTKHKKGKNRGSSLFSSLPPMFFFRPVGKKISWARPLRRHRGASIINPSALFEFSIAFLSSAPLCFPPAMFSSLLPASGSWRLSCRFPFWLRNRSCPAHLRL